MRQLIEIMRMTGNWLSRFFWWLVVEPKQFWPTLLPLFGGFIFCCFIPVGIFNGLIPDDSLETRFRLTGLVLELLGIITVVIGVNATLKLFDVDGLCKTILKWFKRFPKFVENARTTVGSISATTENATASFFGTTSLAPNSSIENRVAFLEEQLKQVHLQVYGNRIHFENECKSLSDALSAESDKRKTGDKQSHYDLKAFAVEDVYIEVMGVVWLIFGAISATASKELAIIFG